MKAASNIQKYLSANPLSYELESLEQLSLHQYTNAVIIPALAESENFPIIWEKLKPAINSSPDSLVIVVINNPPLTPGLRQKIADNQQLLNQLRNGGFQTTDNEKLCWIDASSVGKEIRADHGVGGARKLGMNTALHYLDFNKDPIIFSLDADTLVEENYIGATREFFQQDFRISAVTLSFKHQTGETPEAEKAIRIYEQFMDKYVAGLRNSQSPYAYHAIGSAFACRAESYIKAGGMRPKPAGEDFYFLQALCKTGTPPKPIQEFSNTCVYPSARLSKRVPFGTGQRMLDFIEKMNTEKNPAVFYNPQIFTILESTIWGVEDGLLEKSAAEWLNSIPKEAKDFLDFCKFRKIWEKIRKNTPKDSNKIKWAFHTWFDAFRILKFIHFCEKEPYNYQRVRN